MNFQMHDLDKTKLPTKRNVVEYALFLQQDSKIKRSAFTEKVFEEVSKLWRYAKIPIVSRTYNRKMITDLLMKSSFQTKNPRMFHANDWDTLFRISRCKCSIENEFPCVCADEHKIPENVKGFFIDQCGARLRLLPDKDDDDVSASVFTADTGATAACSATEYAPTPDSEEDYEFESSQLEDADTPMVAVQLKVSDIRLRYFSSALDRSDTSNRHGALHASMLIKDLQDAIATKESVSADVREQMLKILEDHVIDKNKVFRERQKFRKEAKTDAQCHELLTCISFDGKKERTLKTCNVIEIEEHITILKEPNSKFIGYATPSEGSARGIQTAIVDFLQKNNYNLDNLVAISCDGTVTNTGYKGGARTYLESYLRRPLQWFICLFHFNELPFTALLRTWLGKQKGPGLWPGDIGFGINCCMDFPPLPNFEPISMGEMPSNIDTWLIRSDQSYLYRMVLAVDSSHCGKNLASEQPGATSTARWLTTASHILRWYVTQAQPSQKLRDLAMFVVRVYAPFWFLVKSQPLAIHGSRNVFKYISWIRDLPNYVQLAIKPTIESNAYYFHHENILLSMITDPDATVRADGYSKILQARLNAPGRIRQFRGPKHQPYINYSSNIYTEMIDWTQFEITEPPCLQFHTQDQLSDMQYSYQLIKIPDYLCHSQNTERFVQIVHQSATAVTDENRLGHIFAKLDSCERYSYLESRKDLED